MDRFTRIGDVPAYWARQAPDSIALQEDGRQVTYAQLQRAIGDAAAALSTQGVTSGHRVMLIGENSITLVSFAFAASTLGAAFVLVNPRLSGEEIDAIARDAEPQAEIYVDSGSSNVDDHAVRRRAIPLGGGEAAAVRATRASVTVAPDSDLEDVAALVYTSGTTGTPKGVMLTHAGLLFVATTLAAWRKMSPADRSYGVLPLSHSIGLTSVLLSTLVAGGSVLLCPRFDVRALVSAIETGGLTLLQGVQAMYSALLNHLKSHGHALRSPTLRYIYTGGSPLDLTLKAEVEALFGLPLHNGYGMTESSPTICHSRLGERRDDASVGPPIPGVSVRIVDAAGVEVAPGTPGELWVRGPNVMRGYFRNQPATDAAIQEGWLHTGDLAEQDAAGHVFLVGRLKDIIIRSGFNVYPAEVEAAINAHPSVERSAVVGRAVDRNEEVVAFVQLKPGARLSVEALLAFLGDRLAGYKRPSSVMFLDTLPTTASGKVQRAALRKMAVTNRP